MSELEELSALLPYLSKEKVHEMLADAKLSISMMATNDVPKPADDFGEAMAYIYEQAGGYTAENSAFRR